MQQAATKLNRLFFEMGLHCMYSKLPLHTKIMCLCLFVCLFACLKVTRGQQPGLVYLIVPQSKLKGAILQGFC